MSLIDLAKKFKLEDADKAVFVLKYLKHYGYISEEKVDKVEDVLDAVHKFQDFFGLVKSGELDPKTVKAMEASRCGVADVLHLNAMEAKWRKKSLTYFVRRRDSDLTQREWDDILDKAWFSWEQVADLKIQQTNSSNADIIIDIGSGRQDGFDGPSGVLAWAQLPSGNDRQLLMRFDTGETWVENSNKRGIILENVACHEFGHLLGLDHSRVNSALMAPYYSPGISKPQVRDDVSRIQSLYGKPEITPTPVPSPQPQPEPDDEGFINMKVKGIIIPGYRITKIQ